MNKQLLAGGLLLIIGCSCAGRQAYSETPRIADPRADAPATVRAAPAQVDADHKPFELAVNFHPKSDARPVTPTGLAVADINQDGLQDLVFSSAYDLSSGTEPLGVLINQGDSSEHPFAPFTDDPAGLWWGTTENKFQNVCAGDLNNDHCPDVVALHLNTGSNPEELHVFSVYMNQTDQAGKCLGLEKTPSQTPALKIDLPAGSNGFPAMGFNCAMADIDADGDLDLGIAATTGFPGEAPKASDFGVVGVYENDGGKIEDLVWDTGVDPAAADHYWNATDVHFADVNLDGRVDIVASMLGLRVFLGDGETFSAKPDLFWDSINHSLTMQVSLAWSEQTNGLVIAIAANNNRGSSQTEFGFNRIFAPCRGGDHCSNGLQNLWNSDTTGKGSAIALATMGDGGVLDLASSRYGTFCDSNDRGRMRSSRVMWGPLQGGTRKTDLNKTVDHAITGQDLLMWDFDESYAGSVGVGVKAGARVVTLGVGHLIMAVESVKNTAGDELDFRHSAGDLWLSLNDPLAADDSLQIAYRFAKHPDLFLADSCGAVRAFEN